MKAYRFTIDLSCATSCDTWPITEHLEFDALPDCEEWLKLQPDETPESVTGYLHIAGYDVSAEKINNEHIRVVVEVRYDASRSSSPQSFLPLLEGELVRSLAFLEYLTSSRFKSWNVTTQAMRDERTMELFPTT